MTCRI